LDADGVQYRRSDPELLELPYGVRLKVDANAERADVGHRLEHNAGDANLVKGEGDTESADAAAGNEDGQSIH
jgi:hypothetical protein